SRYFSSSSSGVGENLSGRKLSGKKLFFPRESGKRSRYFSRSSLGSRGKFGGTFSPLLPLEDSDIVRVFPSGVGENLVGRFLLFSHLRIPTFFKIFPRESESPDILFSFLLNLRTPFMEPIIVGPSRGMFHRRNIAENLTN
ncbi:hypothetical protein L9F63_026610, partial [Diploptera punctata]